MAEPRKFITVKRTTQRTVTVELQLPALPLAASSRAPIAWVSGLLWRILPATLYLVAAFIGIHGNGLGDWAQKAAWLAVAVGLWLLGELVANQANLRSHWSGLDRGGRRRWLARLVVVVLWLRGTLLLVESMTADRALDLLLQAMAWFGGGAAILLLMALSRLSQLPVGDARDLSPGAAPQLPDSPAQSAPLRRIPLIRRALLLAMAVAASHVVWTQTSDNRMTPAALGLWFVSALLWSFFLAPGGWSLADWASGRIDALRRLGKPKRWPLWLALAVIMALGAGLRLTKLQDLPPEMLNADHLWAIYSARDIMQDKWPIMRITFEAQEPMFDYLLAAFVALTGLSLNHFTLKLFAIIISLATLPCMFWMGVELMGPGKRKFGVAMGLMTCGLVAVSFWHVVTSRYATRTHLAPLFTALTMVFLARAMRRNRRADFIKLGLAMGFGFYGYGALRALPIAAAAGIGLALLLRRISWRERLLYLAHSALAGWMFIVVALPYYHFSLDYPGLAEQFLSTRVFGAGQGGILAVDPEAFAQQLMINWREALIAFHFEGDHRHYQNVPYAPALDPYTGAFFALGLAAWVVGVLKNRRDPVWLFLPVMIFIMMLPSAMVIAQPQSNPSHTRISGAIPAVHFLAALPIVMIARRIVGRFGRLLAAILCLILLLLIHEHSARMYFEDFAANHYSTRLSYRHVGRTLRGLVDSDLPWGNIFVIANRQFVYDPRNFFVEAGVTHDYRGTIIDNVVNELKNANRESGYRRFDPDNDLVFIYSPAQEEAAQQLAQWFPGGRALEIHAPDYMTGSYMLMRVPALGERGLDALVAAHG